MVLLEQRQVTAHRRVDDLREEADRLQEELAAAEGEWNEWVISCSRVGAVLTPGNDAVVGPAASEGLPAPGVQPARPDPAEVAKPKTVVPVWRAGLAWSALSADYRHTLQALSDRNRLGQGVLTCQEMAACFGLDPILGKAEALLADSRSRKTRLGNEAGHEHHHRPLDRPRRATCAR
ncbi:hypothetical protein [Streptomyces sp. G1]|uniref:hypothetical protein n=1 Tax=Streptomyces sp. G1 TaxID=361572 RepID=UPI00202E8C8C|nr:hypothetical protein [Streptomyces sp. G1]MCM1972976.1 hypothetical protein [Streptomyces sp. G1]